MVTLLGIFRQTNTIDTWTEIQSISRYSRRGVKGTMDLSII